MSLRQALLLSVPLIATAVQLAATQPSLKPRVFAIKDARLVLEPGKELAKGTLVIRNGLIADVGENIKPPADALVLDGKGLVVYSGFIDAYSTWGVDLALRRSEIGPAAEVDYASEALAVSKSDNRKGITPEFEAAMALKSDDESADAWRKQGFTARLAAPEGGIFAGQSTLVSLSGAVPRESIIRPTFGMHVALRTSGSGYPNTLMGIMAHFRQAMLDSQWHARVIAQHEKDGVGRRPPLDPALTALQPILQRKLPVLLEADSKDEIHRALNLCDEFQLRPILIGGAEAWKVTERLKVYQTPLIVRLNFPDRPRLPSGRMPRRAAEPAPNPSPSPTPPVDPPLPGQRRPAPTPPAFDPVLAFGLPASDEEQQLPQRVQEDQKRKHKEEMANAGVLAKQGLPFALSGNGLERPDKFRENLAKAVQEGLSADAALRALTIAPAQILGLERQMGTLAKGKAAFVVAMTGEFHDAKSKVRHAFADGMHFEYEVAEEKRPPGRDKPDAKPEQEKKDDAKPASDKPADQATELESDRKPVLQTGGRVLIKNATILTVTKGTRRGDLLIENGKLAAIGENLAPPAGVAVLDARGMYVMPGIIDTHCHFAMSAGINEATLSIVPEVRCRDIINSEDVQIYRALGGGVTTARLLHGSANVIGGQDAVIKLKYGQPAHKLLIQEAPRGVKFALGENVKRTDGRFPNTRLGVEAVLVRAFTEAQAYKRAWEEYKREREERGRTADASRPPVPEPRRDLRLEALVDILDGKMLVHSHCYRADEILMLLRVADRFGFKVKSLQHVLEGYKIAAEIAAHGASCSTFSDWWAYKIEAFDAVPWNAALLHEAGADVCMKSDSNELMRHLYQEAAKARKYGNVAEDDCLKMITLNAARQLGLDKRIGSIEVGKDADLAIFNAHPLDSFARCEMTLVEGEVYFQRAGFEPREGSRAHSDRQANHRDGVPIKRVALSRSGSYLIENATIHDSLSPAYVGSVLVNNGKIASIARNDRPASVAISADTTRVDAAGLHLYPGMIDTGTIVGLTELGSARETQDYAEGGDFQPDLRASIGIHPDSEIIPVTRANGVLTVVSRPTGAVIAGQSALVNLSGWVPSEMVLVDRLALQIDFPAAAPVFSSDPSGPSVFRMIAKKQRDEKIKRMKELFRQALAFDEARKDRTPEQTPDPRLEALVPYARGEKPVVIQAQRKADIQEAIKFADELKLKMVLSGGLEAWKVADELKRRDIPVLLGPVMALPQEPFDPYDAPFANAARLHKAGVRFCIRTPGGMNARNLPYEAAMTVSYGLPADEALKAITLYPAQVLGVADRLGTIEVGKLANLVLTDGDILQATTQVHVLFINGRPLEPTSKQTRLYERYRERLKEVKEGRSPLGTK
jgi:imidazolonepropionase-like amidohydrolase